MLWLQCPRVEYAHMLRPIVLRYESVGLSNAQIFRVGRYLILLVPHKKIINSQVLTGLRFEGMKPLLGLIVVKLAEQPSHLYGIEFFTFHISYKYFP